MTKKRDPLDEYEYIIEEGFVVEEISQEAYQQLLVTQHHPESRQNPQK